MNCSLLTSSLDFLQPIGILALLPRKWKNSFLGSTITGVIVHMHRVWELLPCTGATYSALAALVQALLWRGETGSPPCSFPATAANAGNFYQGVVATCSWMSECFLCLPQYPADNSVCFGWRYRKSLGRREHLAEEMAEQWYSAAGRRTEPHIQLTWRSKDVSEQMSGYTQERSYDAVLPWQNTAAIALNQPISTSAEPWPPFLQTMHRPSRAVVLHADATLARPWTFIFPTLSLLCKSNLCTWKTIFLARVLQTVFWRHSVRHYLWDKC